MKDHNPPDGPKKGGCIRYSDGVTSPPSHPAIFFCFVFLFFIFPFHSIPNCVFVLSHIAPFQPLECAHAPSWPSGSTPSSRASSSRRRHRRRGCRRRCHFSRTNSSWFIDHYPLVLGLPPPLPFFFMATSILPLLLLCQTCKLNEKMPSRLISLGVAAC